VPPAGNSGGSIAADLAECQVCATGSVRSTTWSGLGSDRIAQPRFAPRSSASANTVVIVAGHARGVGAVRCRIRCGRSLDDIGRAATATRQRPNACRRGESTRHRPRTRRQGACPAIDQGPARTIPSARHSRRCAAVESAAGHGAGRARPLAGIDPRAPNRPNTCSRMFHVEPPDAASVLDEDCDEAQRWGSGIPGSAGRLHLITDGFGDIDAV
jgi:hypothetical protein